MKTVAFTVAVLLSSGVASAEERVVSLEEAYRLASAGNLDLAAVRAGHARADALVQEAWGLLKPSIIGTGTYTFRDEETSVQLAPGTPPIVITPRDSFGAQLVVRQPLLTGSRGSCSRTPRTTARRPSSTRRRRDIK